MEKPFRFVLIGTGWRAEFFVRVAAMLPDRFTLLGAVCHSEKGAEKARDVWHTKTYHSNEEAAADRPDFVIASVPGDAVGEIARFWAGRDVPVLFETWLSKSAEEMTAFYREVGGAPIQVAEQYPFQPMHCARIRTVQSGLLGAPYQAKASFIQNYHTLAVLRRLLGIGMELPVVRAYVRENRRVLGPTRAGDPTGDGLETVRQEMFLLDYGEKTAVGDYEGMQQRSWVRSPIIQVRCERGEIINDQVTYLKDYLHPITWRLTRSQAGFDGNLEGAYLRGITGLDGWVYENPYKPLRMQDDEIAVAACMDGMAALCRGDQPFYSLAEAFQDQYVSLLIHQAAEEQRPVQALPQIWQK